MGLCFLAGVMLLLGFQLKLVYNNMTLIEDMDFEELGDESGSKYFIDPVSNFQQLFGSKDVWYLWPFPIQSNQKMGNGVIFSTKHE